MTEDQVRDLLRAKANQAGGQKAWAEQHGVSIQYVNDVVRRGKSPGAKILDALGLKKSYVRA